MAAKSSDTPEIYTFKLFKWQLEVPQSPPGKLLPKPRSGHRMVYYKGCFYSYGGYNPSIESDDADLADDPIWQSSRPLFQELWKYNVSTKQFSKIPMIKDADANADGDKNLPPQQCASHSLVMWKNHMIMYGGTGAPFGITTSKNVYVWDFIKSSWSIMQHPDDVVPSTAVYGQATCIEDDDIYVVGGTTGFDYNIHIDKLHLPDKSWTQIFRTVPDGSCPEPRYRHEICLYNNSIVVLGGGTNFEVTGFEDIPVYELDKNEWRPCHTHPDITLPITDSLSDQYPPPRRCHSSVHMGEEVFIFVGFDGNIIHDDCWKLNLKTMTWKKLPMVAPLPTYFNAYGATPEGKVFTFGGVTTNDNTSRTNAVYSAWMKVPQLRDMCWEAMLHYNPKLYKHDPALLLSLGIPQDLIRKLVGDPTAATV